MYAPHTFTMSHTIYSYWLERTNRLLQSRRRNFVPCAGYMHIKRVVFVERTQTYVHIQIGVRESDLCFKTVESEGSTTVLPSIYSGSREKLVPIITSLPLAFSGEENHARRQNKIDEGVEMLAKLISCRR